MTDTEFDPDGAFFLPVVEGPSLAQAFWGVGVEEQADSGFGSSYHSSLLLCPRKFWYQNIERLRPDGFGDGGVSPRNRSLLRGWLMHACMQVYYGGGQSDAAKLEAYQRLNAVGHVPVYADLVEEVEVLWTAYLNRYMVEDRQHLEPVGVEVPMHVREVIDGDEFLYTIRVDALMRDKRTGLVWVYEHKNLSRFGEEEREGYFFDLQIQGEAWTWIKNNPGVAFGGVMVNVIVCTKIPSFYRLGVTFTEGALRNFGTQMRSWHMLSSAFRLANWPQNFASCKTKYPGARGGNCDYHILCRTGTRMSDIRDKAAPAGFVRRDRLVRKESLT